MSKVWLEKWFPFNTFLNNFDFWMVMFYILKKSGSFSGWHTVVCIPCFMLSSLFEDFSNFQYFADMNGAAINNLVKVKVIQSCLTLCDPMDYTVHGILQARILEWVAFPSSRRSSQLRDQTHVSRIAGKFFTSWATREAKNTGVGSLSLLQRIFPTQESNWDLLHCKLILYQLSYQGSPITLYIYIFLKLEVTFRVNFKK